MPTHQHDKRPRTYSPEALQVLAASLDWKDPAASWRDRALCAEVSAGDLFFPDKGGSSRDAKTVCRGCDVRLDCLQYAVENEERFGIWGGLSGRERQRLRRAAA